MPLARLLSTVTYVKHGIFACVLGSSVIGANLAVADTVGFRQAVAEMAWEDDTVAKFYRENGYQAIWTAVDEAGQARRNALFQALGEARFHGLPDMSAQARDILEQLKDITSTRDLGAAEVAMSRAFLEYARDINTGLLTPSRIDSEMVREKRKLDETALLNGVATGAPHLYLQNLAPRSSQYRALMREKMNLEARIERGGWGPAVHSDKLESGARGEHVVNLRNRLIAMGYLGRSASIEYDIKLEQAVQAFQEDHGLEPDGIAGAGTLAEINRPITDRLKGVIVAMERERWLEPELGERHVLVNQTDFTAKIIDEGKVTFQTRSVIGKNSHDRRTPEFSDVMEHMIINPSWYVPRSIVTKEYLPKLKNNPNAHDYMVLTDNRGQVINRASVDFSQYTARSFPYAMRQPPSARNALGLVKFMFPNKYNIYLHDTPAKSLFSREARAFSHGCVRLAEPFEFGYALLAKQSDEPKALFDRILNSGHETKVKLDVQVPVHIIYRTAFVDEEGQPQFRRDVYGRDAKIWAALEEAGVVLPGYQS